MLDMMANASLARVPLKLGLNAGIMALLASASSALFASYPSAIPQV
ncbi:hypothetical protein [Methanocella arvoryzae]|nr:hypothetical protein [Methanocella arvoryzae]